MLKLMKGDLIYKYLVHLNHTFYEFPLSAWADSPTLVLFTFSSSWYLVILWTGLMR